jgi:carbon dioxide concentrating mechanism protein CcmL
MKIARVIGTVTLAKVHPDLQGLPLRLVQTMERLDENRQPVFGGEEMVTCDSLGAGIGDWIALAEGPEAAQPYRPLVKPIDANTAAILDSIEL